MSGQVTEEDTFRGMPGRVAWPVVSGLVPPLAEAYIPRTESGLALAGRLEPGQTAVLVTSDEIARELGAVGEPARPSSRQRSPTRCGIGERWTCCSG